ncbi:cytidine deaminase-like protein [Cucurbitaria berberidis CBS 394.84]|uniref:Cytidine deaminase-like protein n=1 Tax=Cucurbitaria berberidis CBS 394.84 TaxID=1168544 RepID=A0A9P4L7U3_9PLEO|nr:cytidine deaminase-like protein [Cucurbitaria berberidis CBS 394.84]KAF1844493.1 cytidine deaminase-like protein [Cucurbitaria berberidis CBS 394.84]
MSAPAPLVGSLVPLRTKDEVRASLETHSVYVVEVPAKFANVVKDVVQAAIPDFKTSEISHLRRVVQFKYLPPHLQKQFYPPARLPRVRYFLLCPTRYIQHADLFSIIRQCPPFDGKTVPPRIFYVMVPSLAPISAEQAAQWSDDYWPISYKNTNPYGPHPSLVQRNTDEIEGEAGTWLALANTAGKQISAQCLGEQIGVVVVDRTKNGPEIIAVAGDCRWRSPTGTSELHTGTGNVMAHAVHRAIAMVAKKRLRVGGTDPAYLDRSLFCDSPLTEVEKKYYEKDNITSSGYLCVDLDIYLTNEPCVMCSMAILHSRFRRCVFAKRMPRTGGMTSDGVGDLPFPESGLKHGLFWRPSELNWKFLAWEFNEEGKDAGTGASINETLHV